jgi:hypothetical protein
MTKSKDNQNHYKNRVRSTRTRHVEEARTLDEGKENQIELLVVHGQMP